jgi:hypothetical protein
MIEFFWHWNDDEDQNCQRNVAFSRPLLANSLPAENLNASRDCPYKISYLGNSDENFLLSCMHELVNVRLPVNNVFVYFLQERLHCYAFCNSGNGYFSSRFEKWAFKA